MTIEQDVANLTTQTTALLNAVNVAKTTLDTAVNTAVNATTSKVNIDGTSQMTGPVQVQVSEAGVAGTPGTQIIGRLSTFKSDGALAGSRTRLVMENTHVPGDDTKGGRVYVDALRSATNMDVLIGVNDQAGAPPVDTFAIRGNGAIEAIRGPIKAPAFINTSTSENKKVVFFGSSVCLGVGASTNPDGSYQGWAWRLSQRLTPLGYTCVNLGIGGNTTIDLLNRFYTDVVPQNPDIVVIGLSLNNEGISSASAGAGKEAVYQQYLDNMFKLVARCRKLGYRVIVTGAYPSNGYTDVEYSYVKQINEELENTDIPYVNFLGAVDDGTGKWRAGMWSDSLHPNDIGHEAMSRAFPVSLFERFPYSVAASKYNPQGKRGMLFDNTDNTTAGRVLYSAANPFGSFTFMCFCRRNTGAGNTKAMLVACENGGQTDPLRINNGADVWAFQGYGVPVVGSSKSSLDATLDHMALTYDYYTGIAKLYINGSLVGSLSIGQRDFSFFTVGGRYDTSASNTLGYEFRDIALYRTTLNAGQVKQAMNGWYSKASLEIFSPCFDPEFKAGYRIANLAPTSAYLKVNGSTDLISKVVVD